MSTAEPILEVAGLEVHYGKVHALSGVDLAVEPGAITAIVGSNGAGKTTMLKAVMGLIIPSAGTVRFMGEELRGREVDEIVVRGLTLVPEGRRLFGSMTVQENLEVGAYRRRDSTAVRRDHERVLGYFPFLGERLGQPAMSLSGGQQQMLALARALMSAPRLLMLDEPSNGLAPAIVETIEDIIRTVHDDGVGILLVEQNAHMALDISERAYVLENGAMVMHGHSRDLARSDTVRKAYLGM